MVEEIKANLERDLSSRGVPTGAPFYAILMKVTLLKKLRLYYEYLPSYAIVCQIALKV